MMKYYLKRHSMLCIVVLTLWACSGEKVEHQNKEGVETVLPSQPNEVTVMELKAGTFNHELVSNGKVVAMAVIGGHQHRIRSKYPLLNPS